MPRWCSARSRPGLRRSAAGSSSPGAESGLSEGRFTDPSGYANANAALFLAAFWPAAVLASRRETPWPARGLLLAVSGLLLELGVLAQSRGSLPAFALALVLYLALVPDRARSLLTLLTIGVATALSAGRLLEVYRADPGKELEQALASARTALVLTAVCLAAAGVAIGLLERRRASAPSAAPRFRRLVVGLTLRCRAGGRRRDRLRAGRRLASATGSRAAATTCGASLRSSSRDHPVQGVGADNFAVGYARERNSREEPLYPHSIELRLLSQTGLVGTGLFVGFLAFAVAAALRSRRIDPTRAALASAGLARFSYWFVHGSIDWFWEIPALAAPALAVLGLAGGMSPRGADAGRRAATAAAGDHGPRSRRPRHCVDLACPALACGAGRRGRGRTIGRRIPPAAFDRLERARRLNVLSGEPDIVAGALARRTGDRERASAAFRRALDRAPNDWYAHVELAIVDLRGGSTNCCSGAPQSTRGA